MFPLHTLTRLMFVVLEPAVEDGAVLYAVGHMSVMHHDDVGPVVLGKGQVRHCTGQDLVVVDVPTGLDSEHALTLVTPSEVAP